MSAAFSSMLSQPVSVHNLTAWFMLAPCDPRPAGVAAAVTFPDYRVLEESIEASLAVLHETGSVNELLIENSGEVDLFIQAGSGIRPDWAGTMKSTPIVRSCRPPFTMSPAWMKRSTSPLFSMSNSLTEPVS